MPRNVENILGKKFGRLLVTENLNEKIHGSTLHRCLCECGKTVDVPISYLKSGHTKSCGCFRKEAKKTHNMSKSRLYQIHQGMLRRCYCKSSDAYKYYGGRGISVCSDWKNNFLSFYNWSIKNGYEESLTIDRIDVNGDYEPSNCRWASKAVQARNSRKNVYLEIGGETKTLMEWSRHFEIPLTTFRRRILEGRTLDEVISKERLKKKI